MGGFLAEILALGGEHWPAILTSGGFAASLAAALRNGGRLSRLSREHDSTITLIDNLSEGIYRSSLDGKLLMVNQALVRMNGYRTKCEMLDAPTDIAAECYVDPERCREFRAILRREGCIEGYVSEIYRHKTRERIWIIESARIVCDPRSGRPLYYEGSVREYSDTVKRLQLEERFQKLTSHLPGGLFQVAAECDGRIAVNYLSEGFYGILGVPATEGIDPAVYFPRQIHREDRSAFLEAVRMSRKTLSPIDHEFRIRDRGGNEKWLRLTARPEISKDVVTWHGYVADVSLRKIQALEIEKLAYYDPLTGLPNRRLLMERIAESVAACARHGRHGALVFIDLDNFKSLNDTKGHDIGDRYLTYIAGRLSASVRAADTVARMGGDEFVVVLEDLGRDEATAASRAIIAGNQVLSALRIPFEHGDFRHASSASLGVVIFDGSETRVDELMKRADIAMYQAKAAGRDAMALFDPSWMAGEAERFTLLGELRKAVADGSVDVHFQPQMDRSGRLVGAEALTRWRHPVLGDIPPERFIAAAEQSGMIGQLCRHVLRAGVEQLAAWRETPATAGLRLSVNVSIQSFAAADFADFIRALVDEYSVEPSRLTLEFTEHVMARDQKAIAGKMHELKKLGLRFSLDDFGTGYSSLSRLKNLPFDEIKIDGAFVSDIGHSADNRALIKTILAMAHTMGLETVAEHVETADQESFLHAFGCDFFQGFLYGAALSAEEFGRFALAAARGDDARERRRA